MKHNHNPLTRRCLASAVALVALTSTAWHAMAQDEREKSGSMAAVTTLQVQAARSAEMPAGTTFDNICDQGRKVTRRQAQVLTIACQPSGDSPAGTITARPDVQRSDVNCKFTEDGEGGFKAQSCTCKADDDSNCTGFITWCAKQGGDVSGNNQSASCG
jgi:hypothetical protein